MEHFLNNYLQSQSMLDTLIQTRWDNKIEISKFLSSINASSVQQLNKRSLQCFSPSQQYQIGLLYLSVFTVTDQLAYKIIHNVKKYNSSQQKTSQQYSKIQVLQALLSKIKSVITTVETVKGCYFICAQLYGTSLSKRLAQYLIHLVQEVAKAKQQHDKKGDQNKNPFQFDSLLAELGISDHTIYISEMASDFLNELSDNDLYDSALDHNKKGPSLDAYLMLINQCASLDEQAELFYSQSYDFFRKLFVFQKDKFPTVLFLEEISNLALQFLFDSTYDISSDDLIEEQVQKQNNNQNQLQVQDLGFLIEDTQTKHSSTLQLKEVKDSFSHNKKYIDRNLQSLNCRFLPIAYPMLQFFADFLSQFVSFPLEEFDELQVQSIEGIQKKIFVLLERMLQLFPLRKEETILKILAMCKVCEKTCNQNQNQISQMTSYVNNKFEETAYSRHVVLFIAKAMTFNLNFKSGDSQDINQFYAVLHQNIALNLPSLKKRADNVVQQNQLQQQMNSGYHLKNLFIQCGVPFTRVMHAGEDYAVNVEVWKPHSIINWSFATKDYDIGYKFEYVGALTPHSESQQVQKSLNNKISIISHDKIDSHLHIIRGNFLSNKTGIFRLTFSNKSSWFNSKTLRYRIHVLERLEEPDVYSFCLYQSLDSISSAMKESATAASSSSSSRMGESQTQKNILEKIDQSRIFQKGTLRGILYVSSQSIIFCLSTDQINTQNANPITNSIEKIAQMKTSEEPKSKQDTELLEHATEEQMCYEVASQLVDSILTHLTRQNQSKLDDQPLPLDKQVKQIIMKSFSELRVEFPQIAKGKDTLISLLIIEQNENDILNWNRSVQQKQLLGNNEDILRVWLDIGSSEFNPIFLVKTYLFQTLMQNRIRKCIKVLQSEQGQQLASPKQQLASPGQQMTSPTLVVALHENDLNVYDTINPETNLAKSIISFKNQMNSACKLYSLHNVSFEEKVLIVKELLTYILKVRDDSCALVAGPHQKVSRMHVYLSEQFEQEKTIKEMQQLQCISTIQIEVIKISNSLTNIINEDI